MPYFGRSGGGGRHIPLVFKKIYIFFLYLWAHLHNLIKQNNNFSILKKIENPLLNPLTLFDRLKTISQTDRQTDRLVNVINLIHTHNVYLLIDIKVARCKYQ